MAGELLIVTGPPSAGKSTVAARLAELHDPSALIEGDEFFRFLRRGRIEPWLVQSHQQNEVVTESAGAATGRLVTSGYWTVYDGVIGPRFLPRFVDATGLEQVHYAVLLPTVDTCVWNGSPIGPVTGSAMRPPPGTCTRRSRTPTCPAVT